MIQISNVSHEFITGQGRRKSRLKVLDDVSLTIADNQFVAFLGPSGCGKTTLLRMLNGLEFPTEGSVTIDGAPVTGPSADRAMVFQEFNLLPWRRALRNVQYPLEVQGRSNYAAKAATALRAVGLGAFEQFFPGQLSGGMKQRVGIARALSVNPRYLLMDEPFGALDPLIREVMQVELLKLVEQSSCTIVFVTHSVDEAIFLADKIVVFSARPGRIIDQIDISFRRPRWADDDALKQSAAFRQYHNSIWQLLKSEVQQAILQDVSTTNGAVAAAETSQ
jgi:NitT/TauT family transport system ATP-binding protein